MVPYNCVVAPKRTSVTGWYARVKRIGFTSGSHCAGVLPLHQPRTVIQKRQHLVALSRWQVEDQPGHTGIAIALDQVLILSHAEDRNWDGRGVAPCLRRYFLEVGQKIEHFAIG